MNEFDLIKEFFLTQKVKRRDVVIGIGDDCAILTPPANQQLAISTDTLVSGVHFYPDMPAIDLGYKALAVNLSDLAAAGAEPAWATLALTLPAIDETWLHDLSQGLFTLAEQYQVALVGGDTTHGPLALTLQVQGFVPPHEVLTRAGAQPGDDIYVTGTLGDAAFALSLLQTQTHTSHPERHYFLSRLYRPTPRIQAGIALRGIASAAIDISDGLAADLSHILTSSKVGATLFSEKIPLSAALQKEKSNTHFWQYILATGEDYELCFTVPPTKKSQLAALNCPITHIGTITEAQGLIILNNAGKEIKLSQKGYDHFE